MPRHEYVGEPATWAEQQTPEYREQTKGYTPEDWQRKRELEHEWDHAARHAMATGRMAPEDVVRLGYRPSGHEADDSQGWLDYSDPRRVGKWRPLPPKLYHVTTNLPAVLKDGRLKSRAELDQDWGRGLGAGDDETISLTSDLAQAQNIRRAFLEGSDVASGRLPIERLVEMARTGEGAQKPWLKSMYGTHDWSRGNPKALDDLLLGRQPFYKHLVPKDHPLQQPGALGSFETLPASEWAKYGYTPYEGAHPLGTNPEDPLHVGRDVYRQLSPQEKAAEAFDWWRNPYAAMRHYVGGGPDDPIFMNVDRDWFAHLTPEQVGVLEVQPTPGGHGYPMSSLDEWRIPTGEAVNLTAANGQPVQRLSMAADPQWWDQHSKSVQRLWHATPREHLESVLQHGLLPWDDPRNPAGTQYGNEYEFVPHEDWFRPRPGHTYFTTDQNMAQEYAADRQMDHGEHVLLRIDPSYLRSEHVNPDEDHSPWAQGGWMSVNPDFIGDDSQWPDHSEFQSLGEAAEYGGWGDNPQDTEASLTWNHTLGYRGAVPPEAIQAYYTSPGPGWYEHPAPERQNPNQQALFDHTVAKTAKTTPDELHVALEIPERIRKQIKTWVDDQDWPEGTKLEDPSEYHITLLYAERGNAEHGNADWLYPTEGYDVEISGLDEFGDGEKATVLRIDSPEAKEHADDLYDAAENRDLGINRFPGGYKPHLTVAYGPGKPSYARPPRLRFKTGPSAVSEPRTAARARRYYRLLPTAIRDQVRTEGMVPNPTTGNPMHFWDNLPEAQRYAEISNSIEPHDIWAVHPTAVGRLKQDPWFTMVPPDYWTPEPGRSRPGAWQSDATHIAPEHLQLGQDDWNFTGGVRTAGINHSPDSWGRGLVTPEGDVHTWPEDWGTHRAYISDVLGAPSALGYDKFIIDPAGTIQELSDPAHHALVEQALEPLARRQHAWGF